MSLREELEKAVKLFDDYGGNIQHTSALSVTGYNLIRDHGQALLEAVRLSESIPRKQTVDDYGSGSDEQNMDLDDLVHMHGWNDCLDDLDNARSKTVDWG